VEKMLQRFHILLDVSVLSSPSIVS
jgi:hypothetical protein